MSLREAFSRANGGITVAGVTLTKTFQTVRKLGWIGLDGAPGARVAHFESDCWIWAQRSRPSSWEWRQDGWPEPDLACEGGLQAAAAAIIASTPTRLSARRKL